ncbi:caspase family protein [Mesorhizobium sp. M0830]|uniref:caspase family protein n=1 Tax=Mesorhizobium sp. M0830 TaxID=2957008 RepID=UPI003334F9E4
MTDAALVFEGPVPDGPGTHVLLIGVSAYDHLLGGTDEKPHLANDMGQLASPAKSARALAEWFLTEFENADTPLQSLSLLISDPSPTPFSFPGNLSEPKVPPTATIGSVTAAIDGWLGRSAKSPDNMVVFFFAGHGVSSSDPLLFLQDFGARSFDKYATSVNLEDFLGGMRTMVPGKQLFLIDACRTTEKTSVELAGEHRGVGLVSAVDPTGTGRKLALQSVHHASTEFAVAYGATDGVSLFTEALLRALRGGGAQPHLQWHVGTSGLEQALGAYVSRAAQKHSVIQVPERSRGQFFKISKPAKVDVPLHISLDLAEAWGHLDNMEARCATGISASLTHDPANPIEEWSCVVPLREHMVAAAFKQGAAYNHAAEVVMVAPPETVYTLTIQAGAVP